MICARCNEPTAHRSHRAGFVDWFWSVLRRTPYRCHSCGARFYAYRHGEKSSKLRTREEREVLELRRRYKWKRSKRELFAYGMGSLVLIILLYFLMQQHLGSSG